MNFDENDLLDFLCAKNYEYYEKHYKYDHVERKHTSFYNNGNICYCNASLQLLLSIKPLCIYILKKYNKIYYKTKSKYKGDILKAVFDLVQETYRSENNFLCTNKHINILKKIKVYNGNIVINAQNDAHEFLLLLFNYINVECNRFLNIPDNFDVKLNDKDNKEKAGDKYWIKYLFKDNSIITDLLGFQNISSITCINCGNTRYSFEFCIDLGLEFENENMKSTTLMELLKNNIMKNDDFCFLDCNICKLKKTSRIKKGIYRMPNLYMIIYIKRFKWIYGCTNYYNNNNVKKIDTIVLLPLDGLIDFTSFAHMSNHESLYNSKYIIESIICHSGNSYSGHYTAIVKFSDGFYKCNDDKIKKLANPMYLPCGMNIPWGEKMANTLKGRRMFPFENAQNYLVMANTLKGRRMFPFENAQNYLVMAITLKGRRMFPFENVENHLVKRG
ncbi:ubiquitin specific protease, putative [Plasmodium ovale wallikeri]|uniref:ubiquitinyl hydrolase 1 n=1 Tax=Plasmodium ovale wallikeri TaxID=864142 RepID=A0A1A8YJ85_PLAOA|nr:ubiquitin specific protease, putative [Plasmodium ovale wallikeri]